MPSKRVGESSLSPLPTKPAVSVASPGSTVSGRAAVLSSALGRKPTQVCSCVGCGREFPNRKRCDAHMQWCGEVAKLTHSDQLGIPLRHNVVHGKVAVTSAPEKPDRAVQVLQRQQKLAHSPPPTQPNSPEHSRLARRKTCIDIHTGVFIVFALVASPLAIGLGHDSDALVGIWVTLLVGWF